jgi:hypothetical protein
MAASDSSFFFKLILLETIFGRQRACLEGKSVEVG